MGQRQSRTLKQSNNEKFRRIPDRYKHLGEVQQALRHIGLESCQLIIGVDFTKSNTWNGARTFSGKSLHDTENGPTPYESALRVIAKTLKDFDEDWFIPCYGFGDFTTRGDSVFSFNSKNEPTKGLDALVQRYCELTKSVQLSGPTSFAPLIHQAMKDVIESGMQFHLLLIVADGQVSSAHFQVTAQAIVKACHVPMAIVMVGVGDGPWDEMKNFDDHLPQRPWDNFQFVEFNRFCARNSGMTEAECEASFATSALMELPDQYKICERFIGDKVKGKKLLEDSYDVASSAPKDPPDYGQMAAMFRPQEDPSENAADRYAQFFSQS